MFFFWRPVRSGFVFLLAASILQVTGLALGGLVSARELPAREGFTSFVEVDSEAPGELLLSLPEVQSDLTVRAVQTRLGCYYSDYYYYGYSRYCQDYYSSCYSDGEEE